MYVCWCNQLRVTVVVVMVCTRVPAVPSPCTCARFLNDAETHVHAVCHMSMKSRCSTCNNKPQLLNRLNQQLRRRTARPRMRSCSSTPTSQMPRSTNATKRLPSLWLVHYLCAIDACPLCAWCGFAHCPHTCIVRCSSACVRVHVLLFPIGNTCPHTCRGRWAMVVRPRLNKTAS